MPTRLSIREVRTAYTCGRLLAILGRLEQAATGTGAVSLGMADSLQREPKQTLEVTERIYPLWLARLNVRDPDSADEFRSQINPLRGMIKKAWKGGREDQTLFRLGYLHQSEFDSRS